jgi:tRNA (guanine37-N1)-methyltransferase
MFAVGVVALFPEMVEPVIRLGVVGRAAENGLLQVRFRSPREFASDVHRTVDDRPYGGGPGMLMRYQPVCDAVHAVESDLPSGCRRIVLSAQGRRLDQALAAELAAGPGMVLVAARYEGLDERVITGLGAEEISIGDYVLSGGEPAAAVLIDAVTRLLPGVLGHAESPAQDSFSTGLLECPHFTRPETVDGLAVLAVLLSGDHAAIRRWRLQQALGRTRSRRPELLRDRALTEEERTLLQEFREDGDDG